MQSLRNECSIISISHESYRKRQKRHCSVQRLSARKSLMNNRMAGIRIARGTFEGGSKGWVSPFFGSFSDLRFFVNPAPFSNSSWLIGSFVPSRVKNNSIFRNRAGIQPEHLTSASDHSTSAYLSVVI